MNYLTLNTSHVLKLHECVAWLITEKLTVGRNAAQHTGCFYRMVVILCPHLGIVHLELHGKHKK